MKRSSVGRMIGTIGAVLLVCVLFSGSANASLGETSLVSVDSTGVNGNSNSVESSISADGRYVAFKSLATNLVAGDTNGFEDVFVHDRKTGQTTRVSVDSLGNQGNSFSGFPSISADGRFVAFVSFASNLVAGDTFGWDVFVHDRQTGQTTRVSESSGGATGNDGSGLSSISADGRFVAFSSLATNLVAGDNNGVSDIFVRDRDVSDSGTFDTPGNTSTTRVSVDSTGIQGDGFSGQPSISADGRYVAFNSQATNLVTGDANTNSDVFVHDRQTGQTTRVSVASDGAEGNNSSHLPSISADGRYVAFRSGAQNLVVGDSNANSDVFVHDRQTGQTTRISVDSAGVEGDGFSGDSRPSIGADGRYVAFDSHASNLVTDDTNGTLDIFVHDRQTNQTTRVSVDSTGAQANNLSRSPSISADGRFVAFESDATNLVTGDTSNRDVFVHDRHPTTTRVSVNSAGVQGNYPSFLPAISADGRYVAFESVATNLVAGHGVLGISDIFVHDRQTGETTLVSVDSAGVQGNDHSYRSSISADGQYVAFESDATNLVPGDTNSATDIFVHDRVTGATSRVSVASDGTQTELLSNNGYPSISADGRFVAFRSTASNLLGAGNDTNGSWDIFVHDRVTGATSRVSVASDGTPANSHSNVPSISADGRFVAFESDATNLIAGDTNGATDIFVHDRQTGVTTRVSVDSAGGQAYTSGDSSSISADGRFVAFMSNAWNLVAGDTNGTQDIFVHDRQTGVTTRVSVDSAGGQAAGMSYLPSISADGRFVAFWSNAANLISGDTNSVSDVFVHDRLNGTTTRVSVDSAGGQANTSSDSSSSISADGRFVAFHSHASNLVVGDTNGYSDAFVHEMAVVIDPCGAFGGDTDGDGVCDADDNCPLKFNALQDDADEDGTGDACDPCPNYSNGGEISCPTNNNVDGTAQIVDALPLYQCGDPVLVRTTWTFKDATKRNFLPDCSSVSFRLTTMTPDGLKVVDSACVVGAIRVVAHKEEVSPDIRQNALWQAGTYTTTCDVSQRFTCEDLVNATEVQQYQIEAILKSTIGDPELVPDPVSGTNVCLNPQNNCIGNIWKGEARVNIGLPLPPINFVGNEETLVKIDLKPGSSKPVPINLGTSQVPVAIYGSASFDVGKIDLSPGALIPLQLFNHYIKLKGKANTPMASFTNVNSDPYMDLVVHIDTQGLQPADVTSAILTGTYWYTYVDDTGTTQTVPKTFRGADFVRLVP